MFVCLLIWPFFPIEEGHLLEIRKRTYAGTQKKSLCTTEEGLGKLKTPVSFWELGFDFLFFGLFCFFKSLKRFVPLI